MVGNDQRGVRLEGILTRLRLAALRGERVPRFVLLSAVLSNANALAKWIGIAPTNVIRGTLAVLARRDYCVGLKTEASACTQVMIHYEAFHLKF